MKTWMIAVLAIIFMGGVVYLGGQAVDLGTSTTSNSPGVSIETSGNGTSPETSEPDLILLKTWEGTGIITTEPFTISNQPWAINWINEPEIMDGQSIGILQIMVYRADQPDILVALAANTQADEVNTSYVYETGTFFLTINAANTSWKVYVFEPQ